LGSKKGARKAKGGNKNVTFKGTISLYSLHKKEKKKSRGKQKTRGVGIGTLACRGRKEVAGNE